MFLDNSRRYCRNLAAFVASKPPCVIFITFLCCLAVALFCLGFYIKGRDIVDPEAEKDWNNFLARLSDIQFCFELKHEIGYANALPRIFNKTKRSIHDNVPSTNYLQQISIPLKVGIYISGNNKPYIHGNISHLTALVNSLNIRSGYYKEKINLTFSLPQVWNTEECENGKCQLPKGYFQSCVTILAPKEVLPEWRPETCNSSSIISIAKVKAFLKKEEHKRCHSGSFIYFKHPVDLEITEKLPLDEREKANLHLQVTSYFLFILVITSLIYGMVKGKPEKPKKVHFDNTVLLQK